HRRHVARSLKWANTRCAARKPPHEQGRGRQTHVPGGKSPILESWQARQNHDHETNVVPTSHSAALLLRACFVCEPSRARRAHFRAAKGTRFLVWRGTSRQTDGQWPSI